MADHDKNFNPSRRSLLSMALAVAFAALAVGAETVQAEPMQSSTTTIDSLFAQWVELRDKYNTPGFVDVDDDGEFFDELAELERQICCIPSRRPSDLAKKMYAYASGDLLNGIGPGGLQLKAELEALVGLALV